ncbi:MBL fold metallo-hydrolase [Deinococcus psychrotolerans]|uniref:MBL fold metallo-hydrolase n=1 Tax=Deinococcus psychrotolerans TaxID=2489213 RepID=A0A3G8YD93_9DEIO|nr:MBL fold metallo-hydrolase [Deinococcus psychrotolerans]AZI42830.1 MBL fold metallo-hydrolase [Deinococcus psychrotolerans]
MPDLLALAPNVFLFPAAVNSLVFVQGSGVLVVDTGLDEQHARKLLRGLEAQHLTPTAILNTHSHADHHGGNAAFLKRFPDLPIYAPPFEAAIIANPLLEPFYLYGAHPPQALQTKFLLAPASPAQAVESGLVTLGGVDVELIEVPGHASQMYAVRVGEVLYAADALFGLEALSKHPLTFCVDSAAMKRSAQSLLSQGLPSLGGVRLTVPGHGQSTEELPALVAANLSAFERVTRAVHEAVTHASTVDTALTRVCDSLDVEMTNPGAVVLNRSVVSAHLAELVGLGHVSMRVEGNQLLFTGQL